MGVVYRAAQISLGRPVALKVISETLSDREDFRDRFVRESRLAASLDHPNVIPVYAAGRARRRALHRDALRGRHRSARAAGGRGRARAGARGRRRRAGGLRARRRARARARPSRREARQHPRGGSGRRRAHLPDGLRADEANRVGQRPDGRRASGSGRSTTSPRSRFAASRSTAVPTSTRSAACSTSCSRARCRSSATTTSRSCGRTSRTLRRRRSTWHRTRREALAERRRALHGEGSRRSLRDRRPDGAGRARGGAGPWRHGHARQDGGRPPRRVLGVEATPAPARRRCCAPQPGVAPLHAQAVAVDRRGAVARLRRGGGAARDRRRWRIPQARTQTGPPVGTIDARIPVGDSPAGVGLEGDSAWVANEGDGTRHADRPEDSAPRAGEPIRGGQEPAGRRDRERAVSGWPTSVAAQRHARRRGLGPRRPDDPGRTRTDRHRGRPRIRVGVDPGGTRRPDRRPLRAASSTATSESRREGALDLGLGRLWIADRIDGTLRVYFIKDGLISDAPLSPRRRSQRHRRRAALRLGGRRR